MKTAVALLALVAAAPASAEPQHPPAAPTGVAVGAELGQPTSATIAWFADRLSVGAAIGSGTVYGPGVSLHADVQYVVARLAPHLPLRVGLGARFYDQHYAPASMDEIPSKDIGARASLALAYEARRMAVYVEAAPGIDLVRTPSCTLADGPASICPHAQSTPVFLDVVVGARWYLSH